MIVPVVTPRMKEFCDGICFGINPRQVSPFVKITIDACEGKVIKLIAAANVSLERCALCEEQPEVSLPGVAGSTHRCSRRVREPGL